MTVVILTSGTSFTIPADWTNVNTIETTGAGGGTDGSDASGLGGDGAGGGGYSAISNFSSTAGSNITIAIGTGGTAASNGVGGTGGDTSWNSATVVGSSCGAKGGGGAGVSGTGGQGGQSSSGVGTTKFSGGNGGSNGLSNAAGAGGGSAAGPAGAGLNGNNVPGGGNGGAGAVGDNGSGGTAGTAGTFGALNGGAGGANSNGGGSGGGGANNTNGGAGGLPGGGAGGGGATGAGAAGAGGQIRITYTPLASQVTLPSMDLPPLTKYRQLKGARDGDKWDFQGWQRTPLSADSTPFIWEHPTFVPPGKWPWHRYQSWQEAPLSANAPPLFGAIRTELPQRTWRNCKIDYTGWQRSPIPAEFLVPLPLYDVPRGRYNGSRYQDWSSHPIAFDVVSPPIQPWSDLPPRSWDRRMQYQGVQVSPPIEAILVPKPIYDVPFGRFNPVRYQDWQQTYQRREFDVPLPSYDVPRGRVLHSYVGWSYITPPPAPEPPLVSSHFTDLPPRGLVDTYKKHVELFQGTAVAPTPGNVIPTVPHMWLPLMGVGNHGP